MSNRLKKRILSILLMGIMIFSLAGCGKTTLDNTVSTKQDADAWMEAEDSKKDAKEEEEYFDVDDIADKEIDYSKYEEKKASREASGSVTYSDGTGNGQDEFQTDTVPEGMQNPVEPEDVTIDESNQKTCYLTISCETILNNMGELTAGKESLIPADGIIYGTSEVVYYEGESVFDVLARETRNNRIHLEYSFTPVYNSNYIEGINNLYEFDCGKNSGWMYNVNGWYPNYGCSRYLVQEGDEIQWNYTCDLGSDLGASWMDQNG